MSEPANGFEFLDLLRVKNGKQVQKFDDFFRFLDHKARQKRIPVCGHFELTPRDPAQEALPVGTWKLLMHQAWDAGMIRATFPASECRTYAGIEELVRYLHSLGCEVAAAADTKDCITGGEGLSSFEMDWNGTLTPGGNLDGIRADALRDGFKAAWEKVSGEVSERIRVPEQESVAATI